MTPIRLGAVDYLNARPLVHGLERYQDRFALRFDVPSICARLLHEGAIDVGMIPSIEYLRGDDYCIVPDLAIVSEGPVASVALYSTKPIEQVRSIAADTSSRTSNALLRILCAERFGVAPAFDPMPPDVEPMLRAHDAALLIGDPALFLDHDRRGLLKTDLGEEWTSMTGLPFVWAFWAGRPQVLTSEDVATLMAARDAGVASSDALATAYCSPEHAARGRAYLRDNIQYRLGEREEAGLRRYYQLAATHGVVSEARIPVFYQLADRRRPDLQVGRHP
jgi:chorismate dehydratase